MLKPSSLNPWSREALALTCLLNQCGHPISSIGATVQGGMSMLTLHKGGSHLVFRLGKLEGVSDEKYVGDWREAVMAIVNDSHDKADLIDTLSRSDIMNRSDEVRALLKRNGYEYGSNSN